MQSNFAEQDVDIKNKSGIFCLAQSMRTECLPIKTITCTNDKVLDKDMSAKSHHCTQRIGKCNDIFWVV